MDSQARFSMTTKYSSPRRTLIAKCPSTLRALSLSKIRVSRSLAGPQTETRERIERSFGIGAGMAQVDGLASVELQRDGEPPAVA